MSYEILEFIFAIYTLVLNSSSSNTCPVVSIYLYSPLWLLTYFCYYTILKGIAVGLVIIIILFAILFRN